MRLIFSQFRSRILDGIRSNRKTLHLYVLAFSLLCLSGCGGHETMTGGLNLPPWAVNPPPTCAVGTIQYRGNLGLAKSGANARGRDALARQLKTKVEGLLKDYQSQGETEGQGFTEELITQVSRQSVREVLQGTRSKEWALTEGDRPELHSLICLEPEALLKAFDQMSILNKKQRKALRGRAKDAFKDLDRNIKK